MNGSDVRETVDVLVKRAELLDRLREGPTNKRDLRDDLDVSRSTVYKAVRELEEQDVVEQTDEGCRLTLLGRLLVEEYGEFTELVGHLTRHESLLSVLPPDAPVTPNVLVGAERVVTERHAPTRPAERLEREVRSADSVVGLSPVVVPRYVELFHEEIVSNDLSADLVMERPVVDYVRTDHADQFEEALGTGRLRVRRTDETLPFGLVVTERPADPDSAIVIVYDGAGELRGVIVNDAPTAVEWGRDVFRRYYRRAEELESA